MKNLISVIFTFIVLSSCNKETKNTITDPIEGTYDVTVHDQNNNIVSSLKGNAIFGVVNNGTQIRLANPDSVETSNTDPNALVHIIFQVNHQLNTPALINASDISGYISKGWYIEDWNYKTQTGEFKITEILQDKLRGEFTLTAIPGNNHNPNWGDHITIKGKFYARCSGYGCR